VSLWSGGRVDRSDDRSGQPLGGRRYMRFVFSIYAPVAASIGYFLHSMAVIIDRRELSKKKKKKKRRTSKPKKRSAKMNKKTVQKKKKEKKPSLYALLITRRQR